MNKKLSPKLLILMAFIQMPFSLFAQETAPVDFKIPASLRTPEVETMLQEYQTIAEKYPGTCGDKKYFGIEVARIDGQGRVRFYVNGKGNGCIPARFRPTEKWQVTKQEWSDSDEMEFANWVHSLGKARAAGKCNSTDSCLLSSANYLKTEIDDQAFHYSDCADFPFYLRAYFAFRKGLPFSYGNSIVPRPLTPEDQARADKENEQIITLQQLQTTTPLTPQETKHLEELLKSKSIREDLRYTPNGNMIVKRRWVKTSNEVSFYSFAQTMRDIVSTANYRTFQNLNMQFVTAKGEVQPEIEPDFYSAAINSGSIRPGSMVYKTDGHVGMIYDIDPESGKIYYFDAHPDNSISYGSVDMTWVEGMVGRPVHGGGFKNFRPMSIKPVDTGVIGIFNKVAGSETPSPRMVSDQELGTLFSPEQYSYPKNGNFSLRDGARTLTVNFLDFLKIRMSGGRFSWDPVVEFQADLKSLCDAIKSRRADVLAATSKNIHLVDHPEKLPNNIYGASGDWETYSTPGRDVVFKQRIINLTKSLMSAKERINNKDPLLRAGMTLPIFKAAALTAFQNSATSCVSSYTKSDGREQTFDLLGAIARSPYMSYDPYDCPERRFGASDASELSSCDKDPVKAQWYYYQQLLRNRTEKTPSESMGWSLEDLSRMPEAHKVDANLLLKLNVKRSIEAL